ncbi:MAG: uracil phosphoribosyltransferase [Planctomycetota bacterium]
MGIVVDHPELNAANVTLANHPLIEALLTDLRDRETPPLRFREAVEALGHLLAYEAIRDVPLVNREVQTPLETMQAPRINQTITIVPILRAGLGLADGMLRLLPGAQVGHLGMARNEDTLEPESYYEKLPTNIAEGLVLVADPMLATGGSAVAAVQRLKDGGCPAIKFVGVLAAPEGLKTLTDAHPDVPVVVAGIDRELNEQGYIVPGLGDAGDRYFGTMG